VRDSENIRRVFSGEFRGACRTKQWGSNFEKNESNKGSGKKRGGGGRTLYCLGRAYLRRERGGTIQIGTLEEEKGGPRGGRIKGSGETRFGGESGNGGKTFSQGGTLGTAQIV